jgi:voltage-gated sodium channel
MSDATVTSAQQSSEPEARANSNLTDYLQRAVESKPFHTVVSVAIVCNALSIFAESYVGGGPNSATFLTIFDRLDQAFVALFTVEIATKVLAYRRRFTEDPWNVFDLLVTAPAWIPGLGALSVARVVRVIRLLRLLSAFDSFRHLTTAMLRSLGDATGMFGIIVLMLFIAGALSFRLFGGMAPDLFGNIGMAMYSLFRVFALGGLQSTLEAVSSSSFAYPFFIIFYVMMTYVVLSFFSAIAVFYMYQMMSERYAAKQQADQEEVEASLGHVTAEIATLKAMIARLMPPEATADGDAAVSDTKPG